MEQLAESWLDKFWQNQGINFTAQLNGTSRSTVYTQNFSELELKHAAGIGVSAWARLLSLRLRLGSIK